MGEEKTPHIHETCCQPETDRETDIQYANREHKGHTKVILTLQYINNKQHIKLAHTNLDNIIRKGVGGSARLLIPTPSP